MEPPFLKNSVQLQFCDQFPESLMFLLEEAAGAGAQGN